MHSQQYIESATLLFSSNTPCSATRHDAAPVEKHFTCKACHIVVLKTATLVLLCTVCYYLVYCCVVYAHRLRAHEGVLTAVLQVQEALLTIPATTVPRTVATTTGTATTAANGAAAAAASAKRLSGASEHGDNSDNEQDETTANVIANGSDSEADDDDDDATNNAKKSKGKGGKSKKQSKAAKQVSCALVYTTILQ
jgi:hypothetical protein